MNRKLTLFIIISSLLVTAALVSQTLSSLSNINQQNSVNQVYRVHNMNTGINYTTIQEAINAKETLEGHTIFVEEGTYLELVVMNKSLSLVGENRNTTFIDGNGMGNVLEVIVDNVNVTGFSIQNSGLTWPNDLDVDLTSRRNCTFLLKQHCYQQYYN